MDTDLTEIAYDVIMRSSCVPASGIQSGQVGSRGQHIGITRNKSTFDSIARFFENDTGQVTGQVAVHVLEYCRTQRSVREIQSFLKLKHRESFTKNYLKPLLSAAWIAPTIPDKPRSRLQRYQVTHKGERVLKLAGTAV
jgi:hypothetical protein